MSWQMQSSLGMLLVVGVGAIVGVGVGVSAGISAIVGAGVGVTEDTGVGTAGGVGAGGATFTLKVPKLLAADKLPTTSFTCDACKLTV